MTITINIDGIADKFKFVNDIFVRHRLQVTESIAVVFPKGGRPIISTGRDYTDFRWDEKVEVDLPGFVDPDVEYVRVWDDRAEVRFKIGGKAVIR